MPAHFWDDFIAYGTLIMQIGDGGVVVDLGHGLQLPLTPMAGEYANITHFITTKTPFQTGDFHQPGRAHKVEHLRMVSSDLALNMLENSPSCPLFTPFFNGCGSNAGTTPLIT
ncbi:protein phosphatase 2C domain-containing protein [Escherichia coli]